MIMMKKVFSDFNTKFIENAFEETLNILNDSAECFKQLNND